MRRLGLSVQKEGVELVATPTSKQRKIKIRDYKHRAHPEYASFFSEHNVILLLTLSAALAQLYALHILKYIKKNRDKTEPTSEKTSKQITHTTLAEPSDTSPVAPTRKRTSSNYTLRPHYDTKKNQRRIWSWMKNTLGAGATAYATKTHQNLRLYIKGQTNTKIIRFDSENEIKKNIDSCERQCDGGVKGQLELDLNRKLNLVLNNQPQDSFDRFITSLDTKYNLTDTQIIRVCSLCSQTVMAHPLEVFLKGDLTFPYKYGDFVSVMCPGERLNINITTKTSQHVTVKISLKQQVHPCQHIESIIGYVVYELTYDLLRTDLSTGCLQITFRAKHTRKGRCSSFKKYR